MRIFLTLALLLSSLPMATSARTVSAAARRNTNPSLPHTDTFSHTITFPVADDPAPAPSPTPDPVLQQAERDAKLAEEMKKKAVSDKERIEAENAKLKAQVQPLGGSNVTIPTGSVSTDSAGWIESQMLAQEAARQITHSLKNALCPVPSAYSHSPASAYLQTLIIYSTNDLTAVELYGTVKGQLGVLKKDLDEMNEEALKTLKDFDPKATPTPTPLNAAVEEFVVPPPPLLAAPGIATGIIKSVAELINLFRTDTSFENKAVTISEDQVVSYLVQDLQNGDGTCREVKTYYPALYPPNLLDDPKDGYLIKGLNEVTKAKNEAVVHIEALDKRIKQLGNLVGTFDGVEKALKQMTEKQAEYKENCKEKETEPCKKLKAEIEELDMAIKKNKKALMEELEKDTFNQVAERIKEIRPWIDKVNDVKKRAQALVTATELIITKLNAPDETTKFSALAQLLRAERLYKIMGTPNAYTLRVAAKANGTTKIKKNLFVDAKVRHSAGADLTYQLFDRDGSIARANGLQCYIEYQSSNDVQSIVTGTKNVECKSNDGSANQTSIAKKVGNGGSR